MVQCINDEYYGIESLALASLCEKKSNTSRLTDLPNISGIAETQEEKLALARTWINAWQQYLWLGCMPTGWWNAKITSHTGILRL
jgi:hypothetical protein